MDGRRQPPRAQARLRGHATSAAPRRVRIGGQVTLTFALRSTARAPQGLLGDLRVHFVKSNGKSSPKVFKLKRIDLPSRGRATLATRISLAIHTTRTPRPGRHVVDVLVNGAATRVGSFEVVARGQGRRDAALS